MAMEQMDDAQSGAQPSLTHEEIISDLHRLLIELNTMTPVEIAEHLRQQGIKGTKCGPLACPIANYIRTECAWADTVIVAPSFVSAYATSDIYHDEEYPTAVSYRQFENVDRFIWNFDEGYYSFLLTEE